MTNEEQSKSFVFTIEKLLNTKLQNALADKVTNVNDLDVSRCTEIYHMIFSTLVEIFSNPNLKTNVSLTNEAMNYLAQQFYSEIRINDSIELNPNIFTEKAKLENIDTKELVFLLSIMQDSLCYVDIIKQIKKRS